MKAIAVGLFVVSGLAGVPAVHANLIANGSFEQPVVGTAQFLAVLPGETIGDGWTVLNSAPYTSLYTAGHAGYPHATHGLQAVYLSENASFGEIAQAVALVAGSYTLTFDAARISLESEVVVDVTVGVDGASILPAGAVTFNDGGSTGWVSHTLAFEVPTAGTYLIRVAQPVGRTTVVDNFQLVPGPASVGLLTLAGLAIVRRRR